MNKRQVIFFGLVMLCGSESFAAQTSSAAMHLQIAATSRFDSSSREGAAQLHGNGVKWLEFGAIAQNLGSASVAEKWYTKVLQNLPRKDASYGLAMLYVGFLYREQKKYLEALTCFEDALKLFSADSCERFQCRKLIEHYYEREREHKQAVINRLEECKRRKDELLQDFVQSQVFSESSGQ